jgi:hypothetical protein
MRFGTIVIVIIVLIVAVMCAGCSGITIPIGKSNTPSDVFNSFVDACKNRDIEKAAYYISPDARASWKSKLTPETFDSLSSGSVEIKIINESIKGDRATLLVSAYYNNRYEKKTFYLEKIDNEWKIGGMDQN